MQADSKFNKRKAPTVECRASVRRPRFGEPDGTITVELSTPWPDVQALQVYMGTDEALALAAELLSHVSDVMKAASKNA